MATTDAREKTLKATDHRQILLLAASQALFQTVSALVMTIGALAGAQVASAPQLATAPIAALFFGTVVGTIPAARFMARAGRRAGFLLGAASGVLGGLVGAWGIYSHSLLLLCTGTFMVGCYQAFAQFYRFAASEIATAEFQSRAISLVIGGGVVAAVLGPGLAGLGGPLLEPAFVGSFLILSALSLVAAVLLILLRMPSPGHEIGVGDARPLLTIMSQPAYRIALFGAATGSGVMVLAMTATPLAMQHHHHMLSDATLVIQAHVLGMFLPSFFTGSLIARFGVQRIMLTGAVLLAGHVLLTLTGTMIGSFASALILLGVGWNFLFIGGTTLLTSTYRPSEKARAQSANDLTVYITGLAASLCAAPLLQVFGWQMMNLLLLPWLLSAVVALLWLSRTRPPVASS
jgi:MFS family permease